MAKNQGEERSKDQEEEEFKGEGRWERGRRRRGKDIRGKRMVELGEKWRNLQ